MKIYTAARIRTHADVGTIEDGALVVDEGTVAWVGPRAQLPGEYGSSAEIASPDSTILPGLVDVHVHLGFDGGPAPVDRMMRESDSDQLVLMLRNARQLLSAGVTTARDLGARNYLDVVVRDAIRRGDARGPRLVTSGAPLTPTGGHCWFMGGETDTADELRKRVRQHHARGVENIKIMATGGFMTAGSAPWFAQFSEDELVAAVTDAHRLGKKVTTHAHGVEGIRRAVNAGVDSIAHCSFVLEDGSFGFDAELADSIAERGIYVDMTINAMALRMAEGPFGDRLRSIMAELRARGVLIVVGTDAGIDYSPHHSYAGALEAMELFGMPTEEVLTAATTRAADALGLGGTIGRLEPGMAADFLAVEADPEQDLRTLRHPSLIVAGGEEFVPDEFPEVEDLPSRELPPQMGVPRRS